MPDEKLLKEHSKTQILCESKKEVKQKERLDEILIEAAKEEKKETGENIGMAAVSVNELIDKYGQRQIN